MSGMTRPYPDAQNQFYTFRGIMREGMKRLGRVLLSLRSFFCLVNKRIILMCVWSLKSNGAKKKPSFSNKSCLKLLNKRIILMCVWSLKSNGAILLRINHLSLKLRWYRSVPLVSLMIWSPVLEHFSEDLQKNEKFWSWLSVKDHPMLKLMGWFGQ